jgi:hypothetical protein
MRDEIGAWQSIDSAGGESVHFFLRFATRPVVVRRAARSSLASRLAGRRLSGRLRRTTSLCDRGQLK